MPEILHSVRRLLIDLDGVIYRGNTVLPGARAFIAWLRESGIGFRLVTNNATLTPPQYVAKLTAMGIRIDSDEVFSSALATGMYLRDRRGSTERAVVVGEAGLRQAVQDAGLTITNEKPDWVVVGLDRQVTYERLADAALAVQAGARFVGSNPDTSFPTERGLLPGAGSLIGVIAATTGVQPVIIGKPKPPMLEMAMRHVGGTAADTGMLGDRLDTDIAAAAALDMPSILVLTGVSTREDLAESTVQPSLVVASLTELVDAWAAER